MKFRFSSVLTQYVGELRQIELEASKLSRALDKLDEKFPGIKFRIVDEQDNIRPHMNIFVDKVVAKDLNQELEDDSEVFIVQSLSGG